MALRIHLVPGVELQRYQLKRRLNLNFLAGQMRLDRWLPSRGVPRISTPGDAPWLAFHGFRPGFLALDEDEVMAARALRTGIVGPDSSGLATAFKELGWVDDGDGAVDLGAVTVRAIHDFGALQNPWELEQLLTRVAARRPGTIVEIGTSSGGLLYALAQVGADDATLISIDVPEPMEPLEVQSAVRAILGAVVRPAQTLHLIRERSTLHVVREELRRILAGRTVDLLVIDGDHSYGGVRSDFEMYAPLVAPGGLIALHDVAIHPGNGLRGLEVGVYWAELERAQRTELILDPDGIPGVRLPSGAADPERRSAAFGFGLVLP